MSDIYIPGIKSRLNTEKIIEDLMKVERVPRDRAAENLERLKTEKTYWQDLGKRITALRDSARNLYSFQNPFNERIVRSSDEFVLTGTATREAVEQERYFTVKQIAQADRFLSAPIEDNYRIEGGQYSLKLGKEEISFNFRGGGVREFADALNRNGKDKIQASLISVKSGLKSLLIEGKRSGEENRLGFSGLAEQLAQQIGMIEPAYDSSLDIGSGVTTVSAGEKESIRIPNGISSSPALVLKFETSTLVRADEPWIPPEAPAGPDIPAGGAVSYGGIVVENDSSTVKLPEWKPPAPPSRVDNMNMVSLKFSDGSSVTLPPLADSDDWNSNTYSLDALAGNRTIVSVDITNQNTHRDISVRNIQIYDPSALGGVRPLNAVSVARDAIVAMEGIEVQRPSNNIDDIVPGVTLTLKSASDRPVKFNVESDQEGVKDAIINMVGNYNRLMAEINILTRTDTQVVDELSYLSKDEQAEYKTRLGVFQGDSSLNQFRGGLQRTVTSTYPTSAEKDIAILSQIGIGADLRRSGATTGLDSSKLRGYLDIDEKALDAAISSNLKAIKELFGYDTTGDLVADTGVAFTLESMSRPYVELGGIIALRTGGVDNRITAEKRRIDTMDRQLASKETEYKVQYGQMESAFSRMERMSSSLDRINQQNSNNR
jgi:flagellar hook-associated protein 2